MEMHHLTIPDEIWTSPARGGILESWDGGLWTTPFQRLWAPENRYGSFGTAAPHRRLGIVGSGRFTGESHGRMMFRDDVLLCFHMFEDLEGSMRHKGPLCLAQKKSPSH